MTQSWNNTRFKKSCLASVLAALLSPSVYALESLSDDHLSETTGEGIALLPENFKMVFQSPNDISTASSYNNTAIVAADKPKYDTGFIRIIPVGENYTGTTATDLTTKQTKADIFIYGLALSKTNNDANARFSNTGFNWEAQQTHGCFVQVLNKMYPNLVLTVLLVILRLKPHWQKSQQIVPKTRLSSVSGRMHFHENGRRVMQLIL